MQVTDNTGNMNDLAGIREEVRAAVRLLLDRTREDFGDDVLSLSVVGSAVTDDFHPKFSDINTVLVVRRRSQRLLQVLAAYGKTMGKKKLRAPLLMTPEYIERSLDVFGAEFLDLQLNHVVVHGSDPFTELSFRKEDVRLQCERELKAALMSLRQGYISALGKPKPVSGLLIDCVSELAVLLRAMLWLTDAERPRCALPTVEAAAEAFEFEPRRISVLMNLKLQHARPAPGQVEGLLEDVYQVIDHLARKVDQIGQAR